MKKIAVILSGCGFMDGTEIHEAILALYALAKNGCYYETFAPDIDQYHVINHLTGEETDEKRNVLIESARIARGAVKNLKELDPNNFDGLFIPGGFGMAKNISDFAFKGSDCYILDDFISVVKTMHEQKKPIGALCIAPALISKIINGATLTIGEDIATINAIEQLGGKHEIITDSDGVVVDEKNRIVSSPCYMLNNDIAGVGDGADKAVKALLTLF